MLTRQNGSYLSACLRRICGRIADTSNVNLLFPSKVFCFLGCTRDGIVLAEIFLALNRPEWSPQVSPTKSAVEDKPWPSMSISVIIFTYCHVMLLYRREQADGLSCPGKRVLVPATWERCCWQVRNLFSCNLNKTTGTACLRPVRFLITSFVLALGWRILCCCSRWLFQ